MLFADTCHAGSVTTTRYGVVTSRDHARPGRRTARAGERRHRAGVERPQRGLARSALASGNGALKAVVDGLRGRADLLKRGEITVKGLDYYVASQVAAMTKAAQNPVSLILPGMLGLPAARVALIDRISR
ncbi:MAG: hypothetical protein U1F25_16810 [Rubrivivax sp.]